MNYLKTLLLSLVIFLPGCNNNNQPALPSISISDVSIAETDENLSVQLSLELSQAVDFDISLEAETRPVTATEDDFFSVDTVLFFYAGTTSIPINITIKGDDLPEEDEFFEFVLLDPFNAMLENDRALITIVNDDEHGFRIPANGYQSAESYPGMTLVWEEQFDTAELDTSSWTFELGDGCDQGICGWGNNELQYYTKENTSLVDGHLVIEARKQSRGGKSYTSSRLVTKDKKAFKYGRIDIRAVMPFGQGMWPALWMLGSNIGDVGWPACGEIDIMEMVGGIEGDKETHGTVHWSNAGQYASYGGSTSLPSGKLSDEFHVYSISWDENAIKWYLDDVKYHEIDITPNELSEFRENFYLILNVAVGGNWPGSPDATTLFPQWMVVDYIKVFQ